MPITVLVRAVPLLAVLTLAACGTDTEERAASGALGGAAAGAVVGGPVGAVVGGAVGAAGGTALPKGADAYAGDAKDEVTGRSGTGGAPETTPAAPPPKAPAPP